MRRMTCSGTAVALGLWLASVATAQDYEIRMHRPAKAGQKYHVAATGRQSEKMTLRAGDNVLRETSEEFSLEFEAALTVLEVEENGKATRESYTIVRCIKIQGKVRKELLPEGTVVVASAKGVETVFEVDGAPGGPQVSKALSVVIELAEGGPTDDELFGTQERKRLGQSWNMLLAQNSVGFS